MRYLLQVIITKPDFEPKFSVDKLLNFEVDFSFDENDYGNGAYVLIESNDGFCRSIDLRYDKNFCNDRKEVWLAQWAYNYWNGENGSYKVRRLTIEKEEF